MVVRRFLLIRIFAKHRVFANSRHISTFFLCYLIELVFGRVLASVCEAQLRLCVQVAVIPMLETTKPGSLVAVETCFFANSFLANLGCLSAYFCLFSSAERTFV